MTTTESAFDLPDRLQNKTAPELIGADEHHFQSIAESLGRTTRELSARLDEERRMPGGTGTAALERDQEIRRLAGRLRTLRHYGIDLALGRMVGADTTYIGRLGLTDLDGNRLLADWRSPVAEPFFGATHGDPMGLASRRRYRWQRGRISDYWDEVFDPTEAESSAALDDQSAFIASLGSSRSARMRDVLGTIQSDQDAIIRAGSRGALVIDGGPGTGKTVVALHRSAYLIYSDPRLSRRHGGVLFVGPSPAYLAYVADVLPSLGEEGVQLCTLRDLVVEGADATVETDAAVEALKADSRMVGVIDSVVRGYERAPTHPLTVETEWADVDLDAADWDEAFGAADPASTHNEAREQVWDELLTIVADRLRDAAGADDEIPDAQLRRSLQQDDALRSAFTRAWPLLDPVGVVADLWSVPRQLRTHAPWLTEDEIRMLQRAEPRAWTTADVPLLDAARQRIGDPEQSRRRRAREAAVAAQRASMADVIDDLIASEVHDDGEGVMIMLKGQDLQNALVDEAALPETDPDLLAGPFAHVVVDEAQELTDAEWQMLLLRCPSRSFTIVGDRAQARHGFPETWTERLERVGMRAGDVTLASLTINYRTPSEVMAEAEPLIRAALPDANVPTSIRSSGVPVAHGAVAALADVVDEWLAAHDDGVACVIGDSTYVPAAASADRVRSLTPEQSKGLEFDLVVLVSPSTWGGGIEGAVDRYVAMTRATAQLVVLEEHPG